MSRVSGVASTILLWALAAAAGSAVATTLPADVAPALSDPGSQATEPSQLSATASADSRWLGRSSLSGGAYRSALSRGRLDLGMKFDTPLRATRPGEAPIDPVLAYSAPAPTLSVGLRGTTAGGSAGDNLIERATGTTASAPAERKVGLEWKPAQSRIFLNRGVGIRLDGDDRLTMRLKKGSLGLFMQTAF